MPVESAADRAAFFDTDAFGQAAEYRPKVGPSVAVDGIYDVQYVDILDGETGAPIEGRRRTFQCRTADLPADAAHGDRLVIGTAHYTIRGRQPDGDGVTLLVLEEVDLSE